MLRSRFLAVFTVSALAATLSFVIPAQAVSTGCDGVATSFATGESFSNLAVTGNGVQSDNVWSSNTTALTFTFTQSDYACKQIQINFFNLSNGLGLVLPINSGATNSTSCDPGPAAGKACFLQLDSLGVGKFTVTVSNVSDKSFQYILVGPSWSSGTSPGGTGTITFANSQTPVPTPSPTPAIKPQPSVPLAVVATRGNKSALIEWQAPDSVGDSALTGYTISFSSARNSGSVTVPATTRQRLLTGLVNGTSYSVSVTATNSKGSSDSVKVTVMPSTVPATVPGLITVGTITKPLSRTLSIPYVLPNSGGSTILGVEYSLNGASNWTPVDTNPLVLSNLIGGQNYQITLRAFNKIGRGGSVTKTAWPTSPLPTPTPTPTSTPTPTPTSTATTLLWSDEFNGIAESSPDANKWVPNTGDGCVFDNNCGWGNGELQSYVTSANKLDGNGNLVITASRLPADKRVNCYYGQCQWISGKIMTYGKVSFTYGLLEARIKVPVGGGTWPAFWTLGTNYKQVGWPSSGEQDIMEAKGSAPNTLWGTLHGNNFHIGTTKDLSAPLSAGFHTYGMAWTPTRIQMLLDGVVYFTLNKSDVGANPWPFGPLSGGADPKFYAILNVAMGGAFGGSVDPNLQQAAMTVDWVRYSTYNGYGKVNYP